MHRQAGSPGGKTMIPTEPLNMDEYRVALVPSGSQMVLAERDSAGLRLPCVSVPRWSRPAEQLTQAILTKWNVRSIVIDFLPGMTTSPRCSVVETRTHDWDYAQKGLEAVSTDAFDELDMSATHRLALHG